MRNPFDNAAAASNGALDARLRRMNEQIDDLDRRIISLVRLRAALSREIGQVRHAANQPEREQRREREMFAHYRLHLGKGSGALASAVLWLGRSGATRDAWSSASERRRA